MKTIINRIILLVLVTSISFVSCVEDGTFTVPESLNNEENIELTSLLDKIKNDNTYTLRTISEIKQDFFTSREAKQVTGNFVVKGYVSSSDETGNFFREFYLQDKAENPTSGIKVILNKVNSYTQFNVGREVYIYLKDLYIGETRVGDNDVTIGGFVESGGTELEAVSENQIKNHVLRSTITETIVPLPTKISQINEGLLGLLVIINDAYFDEGVVGKPYFDPTRDFDTERLLKSCDGFDISEFSLETSSFSNFGSSVIPSGGGSITAIITKDYDRNLRLALNSVDDVKMGESICEPIDINDFKIIFEEDFDTGVDNTTLDFPNWTNFAEKGNELWTEQVFSSNGYAEYSGYRTGDKVNISWLISPNVHMDTQTDEILHFKTAQHHIDSDENTLEIFVSTDFDSTNVLTATWEPVTASLAKRSDTWYTFKGSGLIDISSYSGTLNVAFKVTGSGTNTTLDGAYLVDDFKILAKK
ncbi:hypothetical protein OD91_2004 [Lutibacter sp. Hel_I_33_5]|uniref:DUF5689 domain-containing protein n=1 Tax=Lutibacter sp. Hel_I_33_5 TaxID=1566289 RepID=UPI0011AAADD1|nr:DUF5689 domain-containing protein [Lutibacter sp. Hel_I_33_5]TVZ56707.1 hypothetical protein OD91_2004 [Lutibacter sp. Hel_I_33_5]